MSKPRVLFYHKGDPITWLNFDSYLDSLTLEDIGISDIENVKWIKGTPGLWFDNHSPNDKIEYKLIDVDGNERIPN